MNFLSSHGKCILMGEHAVVRGYGAVVLPLLSRKLHLSWGEPIPSAYEDALQKISTFLSTKGISLPHHLSITSEIPIQAGLGSSAALCSAITKYLQIHKAISLSTPEEEFAFALSLENIFHGTSSGIDIAATLHEGPIFFQKGSVQNISLAWKPHLYLMDSGLRSSTKICVQKVAQLQRKDLDEKMQESALMARAALEHPDGLDKLAAAIEMAHECFASWDLIPKAVEKKVSQLRTLGATAVKPTGSGDGGFLLSLWKEAPPERADLIPVW